MFRLSNRKEQKKMKTAIEKTMWMGRATMIVVGLAVILALTFGAASEAIAGKKGKGSRPLLVDVQGNNPSSNDVATVSRLRTGIFLLEFKRNVEDCHRLVSLGTPRGLSTNADISAPQGGEVAADTAFRNQSDESDGKLIMVATRNSAGALEDRSFHLAVFC